MRKILAVLFLAAALWSCSKGNKVDQAQVPDPVVQSFYERYPVATNMEWYKDGNQFIVSFEYDGDPKKVKFREDGTFLEAVK